ncbi:hypothetical protein [Bremerella cremea]|uniref:hypothetical protein n=1 Tax=Bremerella cremea TaxID=1031537 RepID=UPI0031F11C7A
MSFHEDRRRLQAFNLSIRQRLEQAEARIPEINQLIDRVAWLGVMPNLALLGDVVIQRPYGGNTGPQDSSQILQAGLLLPGGLGATFWDMEELLQLRKENGGIVPHAASHFVPFDELSPGEKAILYPHLETLVDRFWHLYLAEIGRTE